MFQQMAYFIAVVEEHNFLRAAERCDISQSAVSQQIKSLEGRLSAQLIRRKGRSFELTAAGEYFYDRSKAILRSLDQASKRTAQIAGQSRTSLSVGYLQTFGSNEILQAVSTFSQRYPQVDLHLQPGSHETLYHLLTQGKADLVFSDQRRALSEDYVNEHLTSAGLRAALAKQALPQAKGSIDIHELADLPCILVAGDDQRAAEEEYHRNILGVRSRYLFASSREDAQMLLAANKGFLLLDENACTNLHPRVSRTLALTRDGEPLLRKYYAFWSKENSGYYVEAFALTLKEAFVQNRMVSSASPAGSAPSATPKP
ncbi:LysR family transcriptional regulator [Bifidobacterium xylocopae]|uniref:LysR family transcriptional regulator n=1 Tax=Bifidobacterium xylocopae TaxID=2493119 RepID=A0A366KFI2_9BIFI|nr:LysR family transcriptional regulator [Bifidobacterium xylocopae]RBP99451.1 LysR family transcriptional regulator [Bifidobacterium xylocopae]